MTHSAAYIRGYGDGILAAAALMGDETLVTPTPAPTSCGCGRPANHFLHTETREEPGDASSGRHFDTAGCIHHAFGSER